MSTPTAAFAPMSNAPMARTPDPVPKSMTRVPGSAVGKGGVEPRESTVSLWWGPEPAAEREPGFEDDVDGVWIFGLGGPFGDDPYSVGDANGLEGVEDDADPIVAWDVLAAVGDIGVEDVLASAMIASTSSPGANMAVTSQRCHTFSSPA